MSYGVSGNNANMASMKAQSDRDNQSGGVQALMEMMDPMRILGMIMEVLKMVLSVISG